MLSRAQMLAAIISISCIAAVPAAPTGECSKWSRAQWLEFLKSRTDYFVRWSDEKGRFVLETSALLPELERCSSSVVKAGLQSCTSRLMTLLTTYRTTLQGPEEGRSAHTKGFVISDSEYAKQTPSKYLDLPKELSEPGFPRNWREIAERNGWDYVGNTQDILLSDRPSPRYFIRIPGPNFDRFLNVGPNQEPEDENPFVLGQITVVHHADDGQKLERARIYFAEKNARDYGQKLRRNENTGNCVECHLSGPRKIYANVRAPADVKLATTFGFAPGIAPDAPDAPTPEHMLAVLRRMNGAIDSYGIVTWAGLYAQDALGPPARSSIPGARDCASCHDSVDNDARGPINLASNWGDDVREKVINGIMPPNWKPAGKPATEADRQRLWEQLKADYPGQLKQWLGLDACPAVTP